MIKQTLALRKIAGLKKKIWIIQGGQGAGKTIAILMLIINHCSSKPNREVIIASEELTKMRLTVIKDFVKVMKSFGIYRQSDFKSGTFYRFPNGSFIKFIGLDKEDIGKGFRCHIFYLNEMNKVTFEGYREIASRADRVIGDFNPNARFWVHEEVIPREDCDYLTLTFEDNEHLPDTEREEILRYYKLGYNEDGTIKNKYWANKWQVYGLGQIGILEGAVFENWEQIDKIPSESKLLGAGVDFGFVNPAAVVGVYQMDGAYYLDQVFYEREKSNKDIADAMIEGKVDKEPSYADSAEPKSIDEIYRNGVNIHPCESKTDIKDYAIQELNKQTFYVTKRSVDLIDELQSLVWDKDKKGTPTGKPVKKKDHAVDATLYFIGSYYYGVGDYHFYRK